MSDRWKKIIEEIKAIEQADRERQEREEAHCQAKTIVKALMAAGFFVNYNKWNDEFTVELEDGRLTLAIVEFKESNDYD